MVLWGEAQNNFSLRINMLGKCEPLGVLPVALGSQTKASENQWAMQVEHGFGTNMFDASLPVFTEVIETKTILFGIDQIT